MKNLKKMYSTILEENFPDQISIIFGSDKLVYEKRNWHINDERKGLRYGENPDQPAALYRLKEGNAGFRLPENALISAINDDQILQSGKHPGKTNLTDIDNGINILQYLSDKPACLIIKHNNPCGAAWASKEEGGITEAFKKAFNADRIAAFGGAIVLNDSVSRDLAQLINENYFEVIAAPDYEEGSLEILKNRKNLRIFCLPQLADLSYMRQRAWLDIKSLSDGGLIVQKGFQNQILENGDFLPAYAKTSDGLEVTTRGATKAELDDLRFAWAVESGVTSNSVIFAKNGATVAIGAGEQDRVGCVELAIHKAYAKYADLLAYKKFGQSLYELQRASETSEEIREELKEIETAARQSKGGLIGSRLVSDGFFPFRDGVDCAIREGVTAIAHPGGSLRDAESIIACNEAVPQVAMVFTGQRSFKH